jgi:putative transposase
MVGPSHKRAAVKVLQDKGISERAACRLVGLDRTTHRYIPVPPKDGELRSLVKELAAKYRRAGYRRLHWKVVKRGFAVNHKAVERIYNEEGLQVRRRRRKKVTLQRQPMEAARFINEVWSMDFIWDRTVKGVPLKFFVVMDDFTKELLVLEPAAAMGSFEVIQLLEGTIAWNGKPARIRSDNGSEFTSHRFTAWTYDEKIEHFLIQPGKPNQNAMVESLNGKIRDEFLNENWFRTLVDAQAQALQFKEEYNTDREHSSLARLTPVEFKRKMTSTLSQQMA